MYLSKYKKVKRVRRGTPVVYKFGRHTYMERPKLTYVKYYKLDLEDENSCAIAVCKRCNYIPHALVIGMIGFVVYLIVNTPSVNHVIKLKDIIYAEDGIISMDIVNDRSNTCDIKVSLKYRDESLINDITLSPGESISGVPSDKLDDLKHGRYSCALDYEVGEGPLTARERYWITLVVY